MVAGFFAWACADAARAMESARANSIAGRFIGSLQTGWNRDISAAVASDAHALLDQVRFLHPAYDTVSHRVPRAFGRSPIAGRGLGGVVVALGKIALFLRVARPGLAPALDLGGTASSQHHDTAEQRDTAACVGVHGDLGGLGAWWNWATAALTSATG